MSTSGFIASRIPFTRKLPVVCIAVSFLVMIVAVGISSGFRREIRDGLGEIGGDVQLLPRDRDVTGEESRMDRQPSYLEKLDSMPQVEKIIPAIYRGGIIKSGENIHGVMFKGVPDRQDTVALGVSVPRRLASLLSLQTGDRLQTYFVGEKVRARNFIVTEIYDGILTTDDKLVVYASLEDMQRLNGWDEGEVSALEVRLKPSFRSAGQVREAQQEAAYLAHMYASPEDVPVYATSSVSSYPQLFDWLDLIDLNVLVILILMTVVAGFNMISGLLIMLFENISTIGLLKALGMGDKGIAKVFLRIASGVVLKGMLIGNVLAIAFCLLEDWLHLIPLNPVNYFVSYVPAQLNIGLILLADLLAWAVIMLFLLIPSLFISKVDPAETVRVK